VVKNAKLKRKKEDNMSEEEKPEEQINQGNQNLPWIDQRLSTQAMDHLWESINNPQPQKEKDKKTLAGNISKNVFIQDKDNWFYDNVLKKFAEYVFFKDWNNYYETVVAKIVPPPLFTLEKLWVNYQKQHEFNPPHGHKGMYSFVVFMKIPTHWQEQHALPISANSNTPSASNFQFITGEGHGPIATHNFTLSPEDEGRMVFFPGWLQHQVFPFYGTEEERITVSGNIDFK
jgi:hypothetical protein